MITKLKYAGVNKNKNVKTKRGKRKSRNKLGNQFNEKSMFILGGNAAGLSNKKESFLRNISIFKPAAYFIQESKLTRKNKILVDDYVIFEHIRNNTVGGGVLTAVHKALNPVSVSEEIEGEEIVVVEANLGKRKVRLINGYGPQESENEQVKKNFYSRLDVEVKRAKMAGTLICMEMDSNAKLGPDIIPDDPHPQSANGRLLETLIKDNNLRVINGSNLCKGTITRKRTTVNATEESVIDHFIVCADMFNYIVSLKVDQERKYCLTKFTSRNGSKTCSKESDHNTLILEVNQEWNTTMKNLDPRPEILNFKHGENFNKFIQLTSDSEELRMCFNNPSEDLESASQKWLRTLKLILKASFDKIRIKKGNLKPQLQLLFQEKETIKAKIAILENEEKHEEINILQDTLDDVNDKIANICADKNKKIVDEYLGKTNDTIEGYNQAKTWGMKKKLCPKNTIDPPCAKINRDGELITDKDALEKLYVETYTERLKPNPIDEESAELKSLQEYLFNLNYKIAEGNQSNDWNIDDLEKALKTFKNNKARDEHGHTYELFKYGGIDLKMSLLKLLNEVKRTKTYPTILRPSNISSIWKRKGSKSDLDNDRGIFGVTKIRSILDKLIYNDYYWKIDDSMSCSNIGGRKNRNIREHLFVINGIMNDVMNNKDTEEIDIEIYDVAKCFDKLEYHITANDFFNAGVQDDKFVVVANSNKKCDVAVKTPWGTKTERTTLENIEMQGTVLAGLKCSISIDTLGKECLENQHDVLYNYKNCVKTPPLSFVDDIICVSTCGENSVKMNAFIQGKIEGKQLELGHAKCFQMHVGKMKEACPTLSVHGREMLTTSREKYLGDILTSSARIEDNILERYNKGVGIVNKIMSTLKEVSFGYHYFEMGILFRNSELVNGIMCSIESLYGLNMSHVETLEKCDRDFFRQLFKSGAATPIESFYLATNTLPFRHIIIGRRLMFYWTILQKSESELVRKVLIAQQLNPVKNDLCLQFEDDLKRCGIALTMSEISIMKKHKFRKIVNSQLREVARDYLITLKTKHTKLFNLSNDYRLEKYLSSEKLSTAEKQTLFKLKTRMVEVKSNFKTHDDEQVTCSFCPEEDTQAHLLSCKEVTMGIDISNVEYEDIFKDIDKQEAIARVFNKILKQRNLKLKIKTRQ